MKDWKTLKTQAFITIYELLEKAHTLSSMHALTGPTGCGKTSTFDVYRKEHENVYFLKIEKVYRPKEFYLKLLSMVGVNDYDQRVTLKSMADRFAYLLNERKEKILLIFDESGKFSSEMCEYFQSIRDSTDQHVGIILSGTDVFKANIDAWCQKKHRGIPELHSRIFSWTEIPKATENEKYQIVKQNGVTDPKEIRRIVRISPDLRQLYQNVMEYRYDSAKRKEKQAKELQTV